MKIVICYYDGARSGKYTETVETTWRGENLEFVLDNIDFDMF